jgi:ABC-type transporter Mla subunit MlaD
VSRGRAGLLALVTIGVLSFFGLTRLNPFADPFVLRADFETAANLGKRSPVRIAGIDVGKVVKVEPLPDGRARATMELQDRALPLHADTQLKVRPRIFFEGNFIVEVQPGTPSAPHLDDGDTLPARQTSALVSVADVLAALRSDTRTDLKTFVREYAVALRGGGAEGLRAALPPLGPALRDLSLTSDALLGRRPGVDLRRGLRGTQRTVAALDEDERALKSLVTSSSRAVGVLAEQDSALAASLPALRDLLRAGQPALGSVNAALPGVRSLAREALPGVRRAAPAVRAALPLVGQARALVRPNELRGTTRELRRRLPALVSLVSRTPPLLAEGRAAGRCTERVLVPFAQSDFPDPDFPANTGTVNQKLQRSFVGLAGESRTFDGNQSYFHSSFVPPPSTYRPAPPEDPKHNLPPRRPDVPCETQQPPNLSAPAINASPGGSGATPAARRRALLRARPLVRDWQRSLALRQRRALRREPGR